MTMALYLNFELPILDLRKRMNILKHINVQNVTELSPKARKLFKIASGLRKTAKRLDVECKTKTQKLQKLMKSPLDFEVFSSRHKHSYI